MTSIVCDNCGFDNALFPPNPSCDGLVSELLRGSRPLLDVDRAFIDAEITKLQLLKAWYDEQLEEIQLRQSIVFKQLENHESIYAPIRRLPRDILIEIFHWVWDAWPDADDNQYTEEPNSLDVTGPLWVLARVCGLWRDTLLTSPESWAWYVVVRVPFPRHTREILQTYLERTGDHLLSLMVICKRNDLTKEGQCMSLVVQCCHRWKNVCISIDKGHMHYLESISRLPALQAIELDIVDNINNGPGGCRSDICLKAPQLRQANLPNQGIGLVNLPPTVTHYSGSLPCVNDFLLLSQLPNLRMCCFESGLMLPDSMPEAPVIMGELCWLYAGNFKSLNSLTAPMLQHMTLSLFGAQQMTVSSITRFFRRSRCRLESFGILMEILESESSASIREVLSSEACTTISRLKLELRSIPLNVINVLASASILPQLSHLCLCFDEKTHPHTETERFSLVDMIRSRCKAGFLKTLEIQFDCEECRDIEADIQTLIGDDLEIREEMWRGLHLDYQPYFWNP